MLASGRARRLPAGWASAPSPSAPAAGRGSRRRRRPAAAGRPSPSSPGRGRSGCRRASLARAAATASITSGRCSMPILMQSAPMSLSTTLICSADEVRRDVEDAEHALGVLRGQRGDGGHGVAAQRRDRLDVGLHAGAAAGIRAGDDQHPPLLRLERRPVQLQARSAHSEPMFASCADLVSASGGSACVACVGRSRP